MSATTNELQVPGLGESVTEATIARWVKASGDFVRPDDVVAELETDKATVELPAGLTGVLQIVKDKGQTVTVGDVIARIDAKAGDAPVADAGRTAAPATANETSAAAPSTVAPNGSNGAKPGSAAGPATAAAQKPSANLSPAVQRLVSENQLDPQRIPATGPHSRLTKGDVQDYVATHGSPGAQSAGQVADRTNNTGTGAPSQAPARQTAIATALPALPRPATTAGEDARAPSDGDTRVEMSKLRETIARRLVEAQHTAAILTTFNEIDMTQVMALREKYKERFEKLHKVGLGFLSFFAKAACAAARDVPAINAQIDGRTIVYKKHVHLSVAVATEKGLIVPVVRNADTLSMAQIETEVKRLATRAREGKITVDELGGGTFTITNGGVFGSLLSTPIINPPQSAILGLHKIEKRAVVVDDQVVVRPMMYVAVSYDHRIVDGQQAVTFLVRIKESLEDPARLLLAV